MPKKSKNKNELDIYKIANKIEFKPVAWFKPYEKNARTHSETQIDEIAASIAEFGFTQPLLVRGDGTIIAGHGRLKASTTRLEFEQLPCIILDHLSDTQARALVIADNKISTNAGWDNNLLIEELLALDDEDYDLSITGFDEIELGDLSEEFGFNDDEDESGGEVETSGPQPQDVSIKGDEWKLGSHIVSCGDTNNQEVDEIVLGWQRTTKEKAILIETGKTFAAMKKERIND